MGQREKWYTAISVFCLCWIFYLLLPCFIPTCPLEQVADLFDSEPANLVFLTKLFFGFSVGVGEAAALVWLWMRKLPWFRPRLGELLVRRGFITEEQLMKALEEQQLRIGETLIHAGRLSAEALERALAAQRSHPDMKLGEILMRAGLVSAQDIRWALRRDARKIGQILIDQGLISEYDLKMVLGRMWYGRHKGL